MKNKDQVQVIESLELDDANLWESRELGADPNFSKSSPVPANFHEILNKSSNMQMISIRLPKDLITDLKEIGSAQKLGYQALMREVLKRFNLGGNIWKIVVQKINQQYMALLV